MRLEDVIEQEKKNASQWGYLMDILAAVSTQEEEMVVLQDIQMLNMKYRNIQILKRTLAGKMTRSSFRRKRL